MKNEEKETVTIDLVEVVRIIWRHILVIILAAVVCAVGTFAVVTVFVAPTYKSEALMIVNAKNANAQSDSSYISGDQYSTATKLVATYSIIIKSDKVMNKVIEELDLDMKANDLKQCITVEAVDSTQVMNIKAVMEDAQIAHDVVEQITKITPDIIIDAVEAGSVKVITEATYEEEKVGPARTKDAIIAAILGALVCAIIFIIVELSNNKIKTAEDVEKWLELSVLGVIPVYDKRGEK